MSSKETSAESRKSALESDYAPLYAVAGLTDALAEALKAALADTQQKASQRLTELQSKRPELSKQAKAGADELRTFVITLPEQFKQLPESTKARIAELQKQANDLLAQATATYGDFAGRGKEAVDEVRRSTHDGSSKTTRTVTSRSSDNVSDGASDGASDRASDGQDAQEGQS
jgi:DNA anti-recombination protein RmuC